MDTFWEYSIISGNSADRMLRHNAHGYLVFQIYKSHTDAGTNFDAQGLAAMAWRHRAATLLLL